MVRSTNTGISAIIDPTGEITDETEISKAVVLKKALPQRINTWRTPTWLAPIFINFCRLLTFALLIYLILGLKRIQQKPLRN